MAGEVRYELDFKTQKKIILVIIKIALFTRLFKLKSWWEPKGVLAENVFVP